MKPSQNQLRDAERNELIQRGRQLFAESGAFLQQIAAFGAGFPMPSPAFVEEPKQPLVGIPLLDGGSARDSLPILMFADWRTKDRHRDWKDWLRFSPKAKLRVVPAIKRRMSP